MMLVKNRMLGRTGIDVSEIGYGAWGIGGAMWQGSVDDESMQALHGAIDLGVNFIDTALVYGEGHSETLVGQLVKQRKEPIRVASKIPPKNGRWPARSGSALRDCFPYDHIVRCTEESLRNLCLDTIDVQQFHVWDDAWTDDAEWYDAISHLKQQGKIRFFGVSINDHEPENALRLAASGKVDAFQVIYNIFDQSPADKLLPYCKEHNIGVIVRVPLDEGGLTGSVKRDTTFPDGDFRNRYFREGRKQEVEEHVSKLEPLLGTEAGSIAELALRFTLSDPAVSTVIPGMRTKRNVERNCAVSDGRLLSSGMLQTLAAHRWQRNFYR
jgi:aryl-alcohol dehydrogenase-like predicted oxidoreductase